MMNVITMLIIIMINCTTNCILSISFNSSTISSSSGSWFSGRNARVPHVHSYECHKHGMHCLFVFYKEHDQCYHKKNVTCKGHIGADDQQDLPDLCITYIFQKFLFISYVISFRFVKSNIFCLNHVHQYIL